MSRCGTRFAIDIDELKELANADVRAICQKLLPNGRESCGYWETSGIQDIATGRYSLKVNLRGATRGLWTDFGAAKGSPDYSGNIIQLVAQVQFGGRIGEACQWLRRWLGIDDLSPDDMAKEKARARASAERNEGDAQKKADENRRRAHQLYLSAVPYAGTAAEAYLKSRCLDFVAAELDPPGAIRFNAQTYCAESGTKLPAMIASIVHTDGRHLGTHRTWIQPDGSGKAALVEPKKSIGKYQGGFIPLWKGKHRCSMKDLPPGVPIFVSEGIEDGLSAVLAKPEIRCIAGVSLSNIGGLILPPQSPIQILAQRDEKMQAIDAFAGAVGRLQEKGHKVILNYPPKGFKDYNDWLRDVVAKGGKA